MDPPKAQSVKKIKGDCHFKLPNVVIASFASENERSMLNNKMSGFLVSGGDEFNPGPETRLDCSELLCNKVLLKYKGDRESF